MLSTAEAFDKFKKRLELSATEQLDAQTREKEIRALVGAAFDVSRDFLAGSYGRHTKTKPLKDVDIFVIFGDKEQWRREAPPSDTLKALEKCLIEKYGSSNVEQGRRCVTIDFEKTMYQPGTDEKILSVDVIPAFSAGKNYEIPDKDVNDWIKTNPEIHAAKATAKNKDLDGNWKPLVKMVKAWNRHNGKPIKPSFLIEVMALDLVNPPFGTYEFEVRNFFGAARAGIDRTWEDPAGLGPPVSDQMTQLLINSAIHALDEADKKAARAARAAEQGRQGEALELWQEILGRLFAKS